MDAVCHPNFKLLFMDLQDGKVQAPTSCRCPLNVMNSMSSESVAFAFLPSGSVTSHRI
jgi:hypothetical protein